MTPVSAWEIVVKHAADKLVLHRPPELLIPEQRALHQIRRLAFRERDTLHLAQFPPLHKDPFDRMLVCQAVVSNLVILTPDPLVRQYPVPTAW